MNATRLRSHVSSACCAASSSARCWTPRTVQPRCTMVKQREVTERRTTSEPPARVKVSFKLPYRCSFGQELAIVGSGEALGNWDVKNAKRMQWTDGDVWQVEFEVSTGPEVEMEYKYIVKNHSDGKVLAWKPGSNLCLKVPVVQEEQHAVAEEVRVRDAWDGSIQDIELEVSDIELMAHNFTEEEELAAVQSAMDRALEGLAAAMMQSRNLQDVYNDPTAPEVLQADRLVAAATRKAVAMHRALQASHLYGALPTIAADDTVYGNVLPAPAEAADKVGCS